MNPLVWLRARLRSHNRHAVGLALLAAAASALAWCLAWAFFMLMLLGFLTAIRGDIGVGTPSWAVASVSAAVALLFVWGLLDQFRHRYAGVSDRLVVGWHLIPDFLLLPARLTFAIWGNLSAVRRLDDRDLSSAWDLLTSIRQSGKGHLRSLTLIEPDANRLFKLVTTLQMLDLIDLHRGEGDWFYTVRSTKLEDIGKLLT
jgi:hypothetical protein